MDKNMKPKISVLMPVYNGEKYLKEAMDSVLAQTFTDFEFIIINDGSKDKSLEIIKSYTDPRIILIDNGFNKGLITSLNTGLARCSGLYTARLDQDDIALPERFSIQNEFLDNNENMDVVGSWTECIDPRGKSIKVNRNQIHPCTISYEFLFNNIMFHSSIFFRTDNIRKKGGYADPFVCAEDYEMYSRPGKELVCANIPKVLFKLRIHNESVTGSINTQPTVHKTALNISFRNLSQYVSLSRTDFDIIKDIMIIKKPNPNISFRTLRLALAILRQATRSYIKKNKLKSTDARLIVQSYRGRRKMMWQHYIIGKYWKFFKRNK